MVDAQANWRAHWDRSAAFYDTNMKLWDRLLFSGQREWACGRAVGQVLEVAIGTGRNLPFYPDGLPLTGIDVSGRMLELARARADGLRREVDLRQADAHQLPFEDASFDTVVCTLSLCAIPDVDQAVREIHRVLRDGGRFVSVDHVVSPHWLLRRMQGGIERFSVPSAGEHLRRRPIGNVRAAGFVIEESARLRGGHVERLHATKSRERPGAGREPGSGG
ncbi:class I SAM-dependent methyltransferase [Streptomyces sp. 549]|uniref:class I SAM-dependent methyltransferase n=1 Tax=Streptomyces sp. 549 TaxID=3049076 RepID=UPI0024C36BFE|nr:class I SAM-dependent methyltransferase [Streptomyces sp. 549]MDK1474501.1 class I SAM-dependent methyltransferase [Streptomyces sp. 549]